MRFPRVETTEGRLMLMRNGREKPASQTVAGKSE
jgi:hypothetical protein